MSKKWPPNGLWEDPRQIPQPWPPQQPYDPRAQYQNPGNTLPYPAPGKMPMGLYSGTPTPMVWSAGTAPYARTTSWQSPVFDLRPSYRNSRGKDDTANTIPIWKPSATNPGAGGKLWVQVSPMEVSPLSLDSMEVFYEEFGHIQDSSNIELIAPATDISDQFVPGQQAMVLGFWPPGDGYPIRFYSVRVTIKLRDTLASDPPFVIQGSYY